MRKKINGSIIYENTDIVDFHSHILPGMDDGSKSPDETRDMLYETTKQGIKSIIATPHFYADRDNPDRFFERRERSANLLLDVYDSNCPIVYIGAEVAYFAGMGVSDISKKLCIEGTSIILVEMPFLSWTDTMIEDILLLRDRASLFPVIAHIERYIKYQKREVIDFLRDNDILIQSNAEFFLDKKTRKKSLSMLSSGRINLLGSDCHNTSLRKQNLGNAISLVSEMLGKDVVNNIESLSSSLISSAIPLEKFANIV